MNKNIPFSQRRIEDLPIPDKATKDYTDREIPKLICRVSSSGNKSYIVRKRVDGKLKNITIGKTTDWSVKEARLKAQKILLDLSDGNDPIQAKRKAKAQQKTYHETLNEYLDSRELKSLTRHDYEYKSIKYLADWLDRPVSSITQKDVHQKFKSLTAVGNTTANGTMRVARAVLNYASALNYIDESPALVLNKARMWHKNRRRDRIIPSLKLGDWCAAVYSITNQKAKFYLLIIIFMGVRSSEALKLEWSQVCLKEKRAIFKDTKNGYDLTLPIPEVLIPEFKKLHRLTGKSRWVFPSNTNTEKPMTTPKKHIERVRRESGVIFSSHDCRRTLATIAEACGIPTTLVKRMINHTTKNDVTGGYIATEENTLREAFNLVSHYIVERIPSANS